MRSKRSLHHLRQAEVDRRSPPAAVSAEWQLRPCARWRTKKYEGHAFANRVPLLDEMVTGAMPVNRSGGAELIVNAADGRILHV